MDKLVTDPREVERLAEDKEDENWDFGGLGWFPRKRKRH